MAAGEQAFCAGADMSGDLSVDVDTATVVNHALLKHHPFSKPIIAAVNGDCVGGGLELLLATDIRATVPDARFGLPEVRWSIYPFGGATVKLIHQIGYVHAMELLLTANLIDAATAAQLGLVNRVVPREALLPWALETADTIAAHSPTAVQAVKQQISTTLAEHALAREALDQALGARVRASSPLHGRGGGLPRETPPAVSVGDTASSRTGCGIRSLDCPRDDRVEISMESSSSFCASSNCLLWTAPVPCGILAA